MAQSKYATRTLNVKHNFPNKSMFWDCLDPQGDHYQKPEFLNASAANGHPNYLVGITVHWIIVSSGGS